MLCEIRKDQRCSFIQIICAIPICVSYHQSHAKSSLSIIPKNTYLIEERHRTSTGYINIHFISILDQNCWSKQTPMESKDAERLDCLEYFWCNVDHRLHIDERGVFVIFHWNLSASKALCKYFKVLVREMDEIDDADHHHVSGGQISSSGQFNEEVSLIAFHRPNTVKLLENPMENIYCIFRLFNELSEFFSSLILIVLICSMIHMSCILFLCDAVGCLLLFSRKEWKYSVFSLLFLSTTECVD